MTSTVRVLGARRSDHFDGSLYAGSGLPTSSSWDVDLSGYIDRIRDQGQTEKCTGEALSAGLHVAGKMQGVHASALGLYTGGRARERFRKDAPILDIGAMIGDVIAYSMSDGVYPEDDRDADNSAVNTNTETKLDEEMAEQLVGPSDIQRIDDATRLVDIAQSLREGSPVLFGMLVDQAYNDFDGSSPYSGKAGPSLGGHAQLIVGYVGGNFIVLNSWGKSWGRSGMAMLEPSALAPIRADVFDFYRINRSPLLVSA